MKRGEVFRLSSLFENLYVVVGALLLMVSHAFAGDLYLQDTLVNTPYGAKRITQFVDEHLSSVEAEIRPTVGTPTSLWNGTSAITINPTITNGALLAAQQPGLCNKLVQSSGGIYTLGPAQNCPVGEKKVPTIGIQPCISTADRGSTELAESVSGGNLLGESGGNGPCPSVGAYE